MAEPRLTGAQRKLLDEIKGERDPAGHLAVTNWPKPRMSNPNFLTEELERFRRALKDETDG